MLDKFNFYDLLGYLIPGAIATLALYWVGTSALGLMLPPLNGDLASSFAFVVVSYVVGHVVQAIGEWWEDRLVGGEGGRLSERLLLQPEQKEAAASHDTKQPVVLADGFSTDFRKRIVEAAAAVFQTPKKPPADPDKDKAIANARKWRQELFDQCYALVVQEGVAQHTEIFLAINGLSRGIYMASGIGLIAGAFIALKEEVLWNVSVLRIPHPNGDAWTANGQLFALGCFTVLGSILTGLFARRIFMRFRRYFAESVYYNFIAWYGKQTLKPKE